MRARQWSMPEGEFYFQGSSMRIRIRSLRERVWTSLKNAARELRTRRLLRVVVEFNPLSITRGLQVSTIWLRLGAATHIGFCEVARRQLKPSRVMACHWKTNSKFCALSNV